MDDVVYLDDSSLPCAYCVRWAEDPDDEFGQNGWPVDIHGNRITKMYAGVHVRCQESVDAYYAEHADELA